MFQFCKKKGNCASEPPKTEWSMVLKTCQKYEEVEIDYFTGHHSR